MIVCSCNIISERDIEETIIGLLEEQEWRLIVPAQVYHAMGKRGRCCGCFPNVSSIIVRVTEAFHQKNNTPSVQMAALMQELKNKHFTNAKKSATPTGNANKNWGNQHMERRAVLKTRSGIEASGVAGQGNASHQTSSQCAV